jgi:hypothetical protein
MPRYEYKVVPAPSKGIKGKGISGPEARFSFAIQELMNGMAGSGWEYQRAETLPSIERSGLTGSTTEWRNVLVFRRLREGDAALFQPELLPAPEGRHHRPHDTPELAYETDEGARAPAAENSAATGTDNGVEDTGTDSRIGASLSILARARNAAEKAAKAVAGSDTPPAP